MNLDQTRRALQYADELLAVIQGASYLHGDLHFLQEDTESIRRRINNHLKTLETAKWNEFNARLNSWVKAGMPHSESPRPEAGQG